MSKYVGYGYFDKREFRVYEENENDFEVVNNFEAIYEVESLSISTLLEFVNQNEDFKEYVLDSIKNNLDDDENEIFDENMFIITNEETVEELFYIYYEQDNIFNGQIFNNKEDAEKWITEMKNKVKKLEKEFEFEYHEQRRSGEFSEVWKRI